jgi:hypothetical protein
VRKNEKSFPSICNDYAKNNLEKLPYMLVVNTAGEAFSGGWRWHGQREIMFKKAETFSMVG